MSLATRIAQEFNTVRTEINAIPNSLSVSASNVLLNQSSLSLDDFTVTKNFAVVDYTGNGTTQSITTGIPSVDFTVSGNGSGYYHDRTAGDCIVKNDAGTIVESGECVVNVSQVHIKERSNTSSNHVFDGLRGTNKAVWTDLVNVETTTSGRLGAFGINGFTLGASAEVNENTETYIAYQTLYTHIRWGLTNQGKRYIEAYNPVTGDTMIMYEGSGIAGHQIPHSLGRGLDQVRFKQLTGTNNWIEQFSVGMNSENGDYLNTNQTTAVTNAGASVIGTTFNSNYTSIGNTGSYNTSGNTYILYGKAKSTTWTIVQYQGTGAAGNFVETKDVNGVARKPRRVILKAIDTTSSWAVYDSARTNDGYYILLNDSAIENTSDNLDFKPNGFEHTGAVLNASGYKYIALVEFDTNGDGGDGYFNLPADNSNLNITNGKLVFPNGREDNGGYKHITQSLTGSIDFSGISDGIKYIGVDTLGNTVAYDKVSIGMYEKESADDNRLVFDSDSGKWYTTTGGELVTNGTFDTDLSGWNIYSGTPIWEDSTVQILTSNNLNQVLSTTIGKKYIVQYNVSVNSGNIFIAKSDDQLIANRDENVYLSSSQSGYFEFIATSTETYIMLHGNSAGCDANVDNISVYKLEPTLDQPLPNPICFLDDKPYQVTSETPMARLEDMESIPKNVMESLSIDGDLEVSGEVKTGTVNISDLPTVDPAIQGELWNSAGTVKISTGA